MIYIKKGMPEEGELVLCTVRKVQHHSVFVELDEYKRQGMIHISEVSPGRIRNIRDFVVEGKKIVCKVLRINEERGYIDLSLRRVNDNQRRNKVNKIKLEQKAEKILEVACSNVKANVYDTIEKVMQNISSKYDGLSSFVDDIVEKKTNLDSIGLEPKLSKEILDIIKLRIRPVEVEVKGRLKLVSFASDGVSQIKDALKKMLAVGKEKMNIIYEGSGRYLIQMKDKNYKSAESTLDRAVKEAVKFMQKKEGIAEFSRIETK